MSNTTILHLLLLLHLHLQAGLRNEFSGGELVDCAKAAQGHEDEVREALTHLTLPHPL